MPRDIFSVLNKQADLSKITSIGKGAFTFVYMVKKDTARGSIDQIVRVIANVKNHNSMKREKDLLNYFNKFSEFINFNELRKYGANSYFQFFDLVGKQNLKEKIKQNGGFTEQQAKKFLENMLDILEKVHEIGFVHGDIKPANIVCGARRSFLVDWTGSIPSASSFDTETLVGDKKYSPPERLNGILESSGDIYSLGCTLYYALTAKHIFGLEKVKKLEQRLWAQVYYSISELDRLPMFWQKLIFWMTQKDYTKRASIADLRVWLKDGELPSWLDTPPPSTNSFPDNAMGLLAEDGYLYPIFNRAIAYEKKGDLKTAFNLYKKCVSRDYSRAENNLGLMYERGKVVERSYSLAAGMYKRALKKGNPFAAYNLARLVENSLGVPKDLHKAYKLYEFSALRGNIKAQNSLGLMYLNGKGAPKNIRNAVFWLEVAANFGSKQALKTLKSLDKNILSK